MEARVAIQVNDNRILYKINKDQSLQENITTIRKLNALQIDKPYGLKLLHTGNGILINHYVTDESFRDIKDGQTLELVDSLDMVINSIFNGINGPMREQGFKDLFEISTDPGFIQELFRQGRVKDIVKLISHKNLNGFEMSACLITLIHLLKKHYLKELDLVVIERIIKIIKNDSEKVRTNQEIGQEQYALAFLCQVLFLKQTKMEDCKHKIVELVNIEDIIPYVWSTDRKDLQLNAMMLINAIVKCIKGEKRQHLVKDLDRSKHRDYIYKHIIKQNYVIDKSMAHELYVYQTYLLSKYNDVIVTTITTNNDDLIKEFDICDDSLKHSSTLIDFEEIQRSRTNSLDTILEGGDDLRYSLATISSTNSDRDSMFINESKDDAEDEEMNEDVQFSLLALESLRHYKKFHYKHFVQSYMEEKIYTPGIYATSERITQMLGKILHVGVDPDRYSVSYHPLIFNTRYKHPFFCELFSRTMWLLSKARREMKAYTFEDYHKIFGVLKKQVEMSLERKPTDYKLLIKEMQNITYETVSEQWQREREEEWKSLYSKHPSIQEIKKHFTDQNEQLIFQERIRVLKKGEVFPKLPEKKGKQQYFFLRLSENQRKVSWGDWDDALNEYKNREPENFNISDIKHFIVGKACPHVKDNSVKDYDRAFTIILERDPSVIINFFAKDKKTANLWIDAFSLLLGKQMRSETYQIDLEVLLEMDCALQLLELQNIRLPQKAPPIPPLPVGYRPKPAIPPKPPQFSKIPVGMSVNANAANKRTVRKSRKSQGK